MATKPNSVCLLCGLPVEHIGSHETAGDCVDALLIVRDKLLETCEELLRAYRVYRPQIFGTDALEGTARAAIAKAGGIF